MQSGGSCEPDKKVFFLCVKTQFGKVYFLTSHTQTDTDTDRHGHRHSHNTHIAYVTLEYNILPPGSQTPFWKVYFFPFLSWTAWPRKVLKWSVFSFFVFFQARKHFCTNTHIHAHNHMHASAPPHEKSLQATRTCTHIWGGGEGLGEWDLGGGKSGGVRAAAEAAAASDECVF